MHGYTVKILRLKNLRDRLSVERLPIGRQQLLKWIVLTPIAAIGLRLAMFQNFDPVELLFIILPAVVAAITLFYLSEAHDSKQRVVRSTSLALLIAASLLGKHWVGIVIVAPVFYGVMVFANTLDQTINEPSVQDRELSGDAENEPPINRSLDAIFQRSTAVNKPPMSLLQNTDFTSSDDSR